MPEEEHTQETCVIVVEVNNTQIGIIVDSVSEVSDISGEEIEECAKFWAGNRYRLYNGYGQDQGKDNNSP